MNMKTDSMADVLGLAALDFDLSPVPTIGKPEAQGDLMLIPWTEDIAPGSRADVVAKALPVTEPVTLVEGRGGNVHLLVDPDGGGLKWSPSTGQTLGVLIVPKSERACVDHRQHGRACVGEGVWVVRRQREQADEIRLVQD